MTRLGADWALELLSKPGLLRATAVGRSIRIWVRSVGAIVGEPNLEDCMIVK
ncbi:hypothetical protein [Microcoleus sp. MON2_D5]|uniref:hypothetical protein n=1 Tax=Microcoleus sp. MON2_D5 TaxID=2818833 RepID=UPI002FD6AF8A